MRKSRTPPWRKRNPRRGHSSKLSPEQREAARSRAARAGRSYPNLVDNMWAASRGSTARKPARKKTAKKKQAAKKKRGRTTAKKPGRKKR